MLNHFCKSPLWECNRTLIRVAQGQEPADLVIRHARLVSVTTHEVLDDADIAVAAGRVAYLGIDGHTAEHCIGEKTTVIDAAGKDVYPGFVEAHCHLGLDGYGIGFEGADYNEYNDVCTPQLRAIDSFNPLDPTVKMAAQAGVDIVDTALSPFANGTSQPATESLVATLRGTERDTGLDLVKLNQAAVHFKGVAAKMEAAGTISSKVLRVDPNTLLYQVPGGMLSNLLSQLKQANAEDRMEEVLQEVPRVREDFGYPPLVTPTSQIVGTQAVMNVLAGERYKMNPKESQGLMRGEYGKLPAPVNEEVRRKVIGDQEVITCRPADLLKPELENYRKEIGEYITQEEDVLTYALFPQVAQKFFKARQAKQLGLDNSVRDEKNNAMPV